MRIRDILQDVLEKLPREELPGGPPLQASLKPPSLQASKLSSLHASKPPSSKPIQAIFFEKVYVSSHCVRSDESTALVPAATPNLPAGNYYMPGACRTGNTDAADDVAFRKGSVAKFSH